jgi:hypothetical protein
MEVKEMCQIIRARRFCRVVAELERLCLNELLKELLQVADLVVFVDWPHRDVEVLSR